MKLKIAVMAGDGIGPEIMEQGVRLVWMLMLYSLPV